MLQKKSEVRNAIKCYNFYSLEHTSIMKTSLNLQTLWNYDLAMEFRYPIDISSEKKPESLTLNRFGQ